MTRVELLRALIRQAKSNGFEFRKWYTSRMALPWISFDASLETLSSQRRYYAILFEHEFARAFWREGTNMTFLVPSSSFTRVSKNGTTMVVERRGHTRRAMKPDAWLYHLKNMAVTEDPLRYIRKFLLIEEDLSGIQAVSEEEDGLTQIPIRDLAAAEKTWDENFNPDE
jgi:hypothetical protein